MRRPQFTAARVAAVLGATTILAAGTVAFASAVSVPETTKPAAVTTEVDPKPGKGHGKGQGMGHGMAFGEFDADRLSTMIDRLPEEARTDLAEVLTADSDARPALIEAMKTKAESGAYGKQIQQMLKQADSFGDRAQKGWGQLPKELKDDLKALKDVPKDERAAAAEKIREDAEAGKYGEDVKEQAEMLGGFGFDKRR